MKLTRITEVRFEALGQAHLKYTTASSAEEIESAIKGIWRTAQLISFKQVDVEPNFLTQKNTL